MAASSPRQAGMCEICHQPIPNRDRVHMVEAHPDVVALRRAALRRLLLVHFPLMGAAVVLVVVSGTMHAWWWRIGILLGLESMCVLAFHFMLWEWRAEKPLRARVMLPCIVCGDRVLSRELLDHLHTLHPTIGRDASRSLRTATILVYGLMGYTIILTGVLILDIFGDAAWDPFLILGYAAIPSGAFVLYVLAFLALNRLHLRPAQRDWQAAHPGTPP